MFHISRKNEQGVGHPPFVRDERAGSFTAADSMVARG